MKDLQPIDWQDFDYYLRDDAIKLDGCDSAIIGVSESGELCYSYELLIDVFVTRDSMHYEESVEWIEYNVIPLLMSGRFTLVYTNL